MYVGLLYHHPHDACCSSSAARLSDAARLPTRAYDAAVDTLRRVGKVQSVKCEV